MYRKRVKGVDELVRQLRCATTSVKVYELLGDMDLYREGATRASLTARANRLDCCPAWRNMYRKAVAVYDIGIECQKATALEYRELKRKFQEAVKCARIAFDLYSL